MAIGVTLYGAAYALVHDGYIHRRIDPFGDRTNAYLDHVAASHRIHHLYNGAPYGMLAPVVPAALRAKAARTERDPFAEVDTPRRRRPGVAADPADCLVDCPRGAARFRSLSTRQGHCLQAPIV